MSTLNSTVLKEQAERLRELESALESAKAEAKRLEGECDALRGEIIAHLQDANLSSARIPGFGSIAVTSRDYDRCSLDDMPALCAILKEEGFAGVVREGINPQTLTSLMKELRTSEDATKRSTLAKITPLVQTWTKFGVRFGK